jgi:hypothetical protein
MENEVNRLEEKYRDLEQLKVLEDRIEGLKKEIAWAQVIEKEKVCIVSISSRLISPFARCERVD